MLGHSLPQKLSMVSGGRDGGREGRRREGGKEGGREKGGKEGGREGE